MIDLGTRIRELRNAGALTLPLPGSGQTGARHIALMRIGAADLSTARLAEAHADAIAILAEQHQEPGTDGVYGVWASDGPQSRLLASRTENGWSLTGVKQYCSGAGILDAALVTAHSAEGLLLVDVPLEAAGIAVLESQWVSPGFADTSTGAVRFDAVNVPRSAVLGRPGWYLQRPGFWHGAIGPAACWAGGALSLIDAAAKTNRADAHSRAQVGALLAIAWGMEAVLVKAGDEVDANPTDSGQARVRALKIRHLIERWCTETLDRFGQATGPQLLAYDRFVVHQHAALLLYIRQCHGLRDLEEILGESRG